MLELIRSGRAAELVNSGAILRTAFCGPCFGAGDVPGNSGLSIRHSTRNFPNREGSKPGEGQISAVALMDSRSIAATAANGGVLTPATEIEINYTEPDYHFDGSVYSKRVYNGYKKPHPDEKLVYGPNIADWPEFYECPEAMLLNVAALLTDSVTTTDELIPSGETSSYRSNPEKLSSFALSRKDPSYVKTAKDIRDKEKNRRNGIDTGLEGLFSKLSGITGRSPDEIMVGTLVAAVKPGDGSAREQAASCQRVLGGLANIAKEYATKRYRSNLINWGMLPFVTKDFDKLSKSDWIFIDDVRKTLLSGGSSFKGKIIGENGVTDIDLDIGKITDDERMIILKGCLINYNKR